MLTKTPLHPRPNHVVGVEGQGLAQQQIPREVIAQSQWIASLAIIQSKVPFEICTSDLIGAGTPAKRCRVRCYRAATHPRSDQPARAGEAALAASGLAPSWPPTIDAAVSAPRLPHAVQSRFDWDGSAGLARRPLIPTDHESDTVQSICPRWND